VQLKSPNSRGTLYLLLAAGGLTGGAWATSVSAVTSSSDAVATGTLRFTTGATNDSGVGATNLAAGDTISREVDLDSTGGTSANRQITLKFFARRSSLLDTDPTNGLQVRIRECPKAWRRTVTDAESRAFEYTCAPGATTVSINGATFTSVGELETKAGALTLNPQDGSGKDFLVVSLTLPAIAPGDPGKVAACSGTAGGTPATEDLQGCSAMLTYVFQATPWSVAAR
jgi:hypothetical protein